jgi:AcrR family transcriptional regulator
VGGNDGRQALIDAAIGSIAERGAARTQPKDLTQTLGLSKSLVNFRFDGRDGLLAEAIATALERHVDELRTSVASAGASPMARLLAWIDSFLSWTAANPGMAAAVTFPEWVAAVPVPLDGATSRIAVANMARLDLLYSLIDEARGRDASGAASDRLDPVSHDGNPDICLWWLLDGAATAVANHPDHLDGIRATVRTHITALLSA